MAGMYPENKEITVFGKTVKFPGVNAEGKFTNGDFANPDVPPSYLDADTFNLVIDNLNRLIAHLGNAADNVNTDQLTKLFTITADKNKAVKRDAGGRAKVAAPEAEDDIARKKEVDEIINGEVHLKKLTVEGNIIQNGENFITHAEDVYTKKDMIHLREGAVAALASNALAGLIAERYDGSKNGVLAFDKTGTARVGDEGDAQPLATRAESSEMSDGAFVRWNGGKQRLETQGGTHITVTNSYDTGTIEYDKTIVINAESPVILTLGNGTYAGIEVKIINSTQKDHAIRGTTARDGDSTLQAGQIQTVIWNGNKWEGLSCPRIGEVYVQYPQQTSPTDLFVCTKWKLQEQYAGAFFRATGGNAAAFIEKTGELTAQKEGLPNITGYDTLGWYGEHIGIVNNGGDNAGAFITGEIRDGSYGGDSRGGGNVSRGVKFDASKSNPIYGNAEHVTPENYSEKLWLRVA